MLHTPILLLLRKASLHSTAGRVEESESLYRQILARDPSQFEAFHQLGILRAQKGFVDEGIQFLFQGLSLKPESVEIAKSLVYFLLEENRKNEAIQVLKNCKLSSPSDTAFILDLGTFFHYKGLFEEAVFVYSSLLSMWPNHEKALCNTGLALLDMGNYEESLSFLERVMRCNPMHVPSRANRSLILLLQGKYREGFAEYEQCRHTEGYNQDLLLSSPSWKGEEIKDKTILVIEEQGAGDSLQFFRYLSLIQQRAGKVILFCRKSLVSLFSYSLESISVLSSEEPLPLHDFHFFMMSAPNVFGVEPKEIPRDIPYITPSDSDLKRWSEKFSSCPERKIGLVFAGNPDHRSDRARSIHPSLFSPFTEVTQSVFFSLQKSELPMKSSMDFPVKDFTEEFFTFADTAACIAHLDLIITVDTSIAHLAGAMGKPVWVLLPYVPDWRWMLHRSDSYWYPTMRLFRQKTRGDWHSVIEEVKKELLL